MKKHIRYTYALLLLCALLLVSACSTYDTKPYNEPADENIHYLAVPDVWQIEAKLGIKNDTDSGSVTLSWQQQQDNYIIRLSGPLGQGSATLTGNQQFIMIERPGKETVFSNEPIQLIQQTLGWDLPLHDLPYWVRGLKSPSNHSLTNPLTDPITTYNDAGTLTQLTQMGWMIDYSRYRPQQNRLMPHKIRAKNNDATLTLLIKEWLFPEVDSNSSAETIPNLTTTRP